ncbi:hypothetical protein CHCC14820_2119 [Bacillus paralicheniformis]|nr:hypothetical protein CHCC20348_1417 [Bacillus paralicheniformis]TWL08653.1 hypothetical protein CHCC19467_4248 [Bacillus paralicheniformis]TWM28793.1 hypothetical protein CHCC14820_2119 [Bacillus paralicheniformis]TWN39507.1 hypothetical protein CHCC14527_1549 [Bacillus paralicheniformis]
MTPLSMSTNISYCSFKVFTNFLLIGFLHSKNALKKGSF